MKVATMGWNVRRRVASIISVAAIAAGGVIPSPAEEVPPSTFRETTTVTVIEVPVVVLEKGTPVRDLSVEDFVLLQEGVEQTITGFEQVDLSLAVVGEGQSVSQSMSLAGRRYFLLAFDLSHTQPANSRRAVESARNLVEEGLHSTDLVGISIYSALAGARLLHPFTSSRAQLELALLAVEAVTSRDPEVVEQVRGLLQRTEGQTAETLLLFLEEVRSFTAQQGKGLESTVGPAGEWLSTVDASGAGGALMAEILAEMEAFHQEDLIYVGRDRSLGLLETLADLATALEEVRGQKYFVLFSEGIDESLFEDYSNTQGARDLAGVMKSFRRSGWIVQSVNVARTTSVDRGMFLLANETGGREYRDFNRLDEAMTQLLEQTSVSYVLSFQPIDLVHDGSYHRVEVKLKLRKGAQVTNRDGFFAPRPLDGEEELERDSLVAVADEVASEREGGPFKVTAMAAPFKRTTATALVKTVVEIDGPGLLLDQQGALLELEVASYLLDEEMGAVSLSTRRLTIDIARQGELIHGGGVKVLDEQLLGRGEHRLRIVVFDRERGRQSVVTVPVRVPDFPNGEPQILEPFFPELSRGWLVVREIDPDGRSANDTPFQFGGRTFVPRVEIGLEAGVRVPIFIMAFDLPGPRPELRLELVAADGTRPQAGFLEFVSEPERTENGLIRFMAELETAGMDPGSYRVRVTFEDAAHGGSKVSSRAFEIRPSGG